MPRFEFSDENSHKFWEITLVGKSYIVVFGRIGNAGQTQEKSFPTKEKAKHEYEKLITEKMRKGYIEVTADVLPSTPRPVFRRKSEDALKKMLWPLGIDLLTFQKLDFEDEEHPRRDSYYTFDVSPKSAVKVWETLRRMSDESGYYPVITDSYDQLFEFIEFNEEDPANIVRESERINPTEWLNEKSAELKINAEVEGSWTGQNGVSDGDYYTVNSVDNGSKLTIVMCPTKTAWHVPAVLKWGGSNDGIEPPFHTAMFKKWQGEYGAEIVCATNAVLEMKVANPPNTKESAMKLAHEHYVYCQDIVEQGTQTIANLAGELINSPRWFFWWD